MHKKKKKKKSVKWWRAKNLRYSAWVKMFVKQADRGQKVGQTDGAFKLKCYIKEVLTLTLQRSGHHARSHTLQWAVMPFFLVQGAGCMINSASYFPCLPDNCDRGPECPELLSPIGLCARNQSMLLPWLKRGHLVEWWSPLTEIKIWWSQ